MANNRLSLILILIGSGCLILSVALFVLIFRTVIAAELNYAFSGRDAKAAEVAIEPQKEAKEKTPEKPKTTIVAADPYFSIVIPKIGANAKVIANVDPNNEVEYQWQLSKGVAHAKGTAIPGEPGNAFLFAHSAGDFYKANQYNGVFYLLNKLEKGDKIHIVYYKQKYVYKVTDTKVVNPKEVKYLENKKGKKPTITLMTCTPAGTTIDRLLVFGELVEEESN